METNQIFTSAATNNDWYSEEFIYASVVRYLKENGYKVQKENRQKEGEKPERIIIASKFFQKEIIEVKGFPYYHPNHLHAVAPKAVQAKSWFTEALFNSFVNFSSFENNEVAMAVPNVGRYQAIIKNLNDYFTINDLYFKIYLVNEDASVDVSNLNQKYLQIVS
ncbi:hypothetical protein [Segetibacter sp.]|jgi:hypothetical protein|uniref:hypothetical protein n=1 Tax=Segetibacter sp. TaxID=2231182 RepID=UPI00262185B7|nr:hypothetical protein [Segetibacter sp.]MCW3080052.1 hypothetical protein [Segetibacter sp.]